MHNISRPLETEFIRFFTMSFACLRKFILNHSLRNISYLFVRNKDGVEGHALRHGNKNKLTN